MYSFKCLSLLLFTLFVLQCKESVKPAPDVAIDPQSALARGLKGSVQKVEYYRFESDANANGLVDSTHVPILDSTLVFFSNGLLQTKLEKNGDETSYFYGNNILALISTYNSKYASKTFYLKCYTNDTYEKLAIQLRVVYMMDERH